MAEALLALEGLRAGYGDAVVLDGITFQVRDGGLMAYGSRIEEDFRRAAVYIDRILKGAKPADLPAEQPTRHYLTINAKTAAALGLTLAPALLFRADELYQ